MIAKRLLGLVPLQIAQALVGFCAIAVFTRLMSPDEFGRYALALSLSMLAHTLAFTWAEAAAYRHFAAAKAENALKDHFATLLAIAAALGVGALALTALLLWVFQAHADIVALSTFAAGAAVLRFILRLARETERASLDVHRYAASEAAYLVLGFAAGVALLTVTDLGAAAPFAGLALAGALVLFVDAPRLIARARGGKLSPPRAAAYAGYGAPLALAMAVDLGVQAIVRVILAQQSGEAALGAYAAAFGLARPVDLVFIWAGTALTPLLLAAYEEKGAGAAREAAGKVFTTIAALAAPCAIGLALTASPLASLLIGQGLSAQAAQAAPWLAITGLLAGFNLYYWSEAFQLTRRTGLRAAVMVAPGLAQIALTALFAREYGAMGAAIAAAGAAALATLLLALVGRKLVALPAPLGDLSRIAGACAVMAGAVLITPDHLVGKVLVGVAAYAFAAWALDLGGARARASAVLQSIAARLRGGFPQTAER